MADISPAPKKLTMTEMANLHAAGTGDRWAYILGWQAFVAGKKLELAMARVKGDEARHSFRCGYFAANDSAPAA